MSVTDLYSLGDLRTKLHTKIRYTAAQQRAISRASKAWMAFLAIPPYLRRRFGYQPDAGNSGSGYEAPDRHKKDYKHVFHTKLKDLAWLYEQARHVGGNEARLLVYESSEALKRMQELIFDFARELEREFGLVGFRDDVAADIGESILRHLFYPPGFRKLGEEIAVGHVDKGGFTIGNKESHGGFEYLSLAGTWEPLPLAAEEAVAYGSLRLQYRTDNEVKGLCHRVVANEQTVRSGRESMVTFVNFKNTPYYNKRLLGPTQNQALGFNYAIDWEEFKQLFAPYE